MVIYVRALEKGFVTASVSTNVPSSVLHSIRNNTTDAATRAANYHKFPALRSSHCWLDYKATNGQRSAPSLNIIFKSRRMTQSKKHEA